MRRQRDGQKERWWKALVREQARSGQTVRAFCQQRQVSENSFYFWRKELRRRADDAAASASSKTPAAAPPVFAAVSVAELPVSRFATIEIVLPSGVRVQVAAGADHETLRMVLAALEPSRC